MEKVYDDLKQIQKLLWLDDDRMDQDTLFEVQDKMSAVLLFVAKNAKKEKDLIVSFPWLYKRS